MRILIVNRYMSIYGGAEQLVKELSSNLTRRKIEHLIVTLNISQEVIQRMPQANVVTPARNFPYALRSSSLSSSAGILKEIYYLRRLIKRHYRDFDVINVHNFPANWVTGGLRKPVVWMCNEVADFYNNPKHSLFVKGIRAVGIEIDKYFVNNYTDIICVADRLNARIVADRYKRRSYIVPYGIDAPPDPEFLETKRQSICAKYGIRSNDFILLQVGVVSPTKNQKESIDALIAVKDEVANAKLILVGGDQNPYADFLKEYSKTHGLEDRVVFTGLVSKEEVYCLYSVCNLSLFPVKLQGGYLSVFEALSLGVPVIVYPTMGAASLVSDHDLGVVSENLAFSIKDIHDNYSCHKEKSRKAGLWVIDNLTWQNFCDRLIEIFDKACKRERL